MGATLVHVHVAGDGWGREDASFWEDAVRCSGWWWGHGLGAGEAGRVSAMVMVVVVVVCMRVGGGSGDGEQGRWYRPTLRPSRTRPALRNPMGGGVGWSGVVGAGGVTVQPTRACSRWPPQLALAATSPASPCITFWSPITLLLLLLPMLLLLPPQALDAPGTGLVVNERLINCPPKLAPPMLQFLLEEVADAAAEDSDEEDEAGKGGADERAKVGGAGDGQVNGTT